ncbi:restriction endonuclease subunit S [Vibrio campbellii]|uniref:restriction endonuclease subunit S n=1 Tax=Vibrio campbellii TaxID=680 RepID=UPI0009A53459|nr:restriction endonuclease subunit S [Vibrio campbellii]OPH49433.1 hypothetical protein B4U81_20665 [Vibrio campbellii]
MSNVVPEGWEYKPLSSLADIDKGSLKASTDSDYKFRYIDIASVSTGRIDLPSERISFAEAPSRARKKVQSGDVLMSTVRPNLKSFAYFEAKGNDYIASTGFSVIRAVNGNDGRFLFNSILADDITRQIEAKIVGSNYPAINSSDVKNLEVLTPTKPEQKKIAAILTSVDDVIEKTQAQIDKLKGLKTGMMQELLTRGVGVDGNPYTEFKDSPVGRIPKGWEVRRLDSLATVVDSMHKTPRFTESGKPMVRVTEIRQSEVLNISGAMNVDKDTFDTFSKNYRPRFGDTLIARVGAYFGATSYIGDTKEFCLGQNTASIRPVHIDSNYLFIYLNSQIIRQQMDDAVAVGAQPSLSLKAIKELSIALPSTDEQELIAKSICSVRNKVDALVNKLNQQKLLKKALMQDLLTGKVRVKVES